MDDLIRDLIEWCPSDGADAWPIMRQAAAELRTLRAELALWKRLHTENCENYDRVCAEREWLRDQATEADEIIAPLRSKIVRLERTLAMPDLNAADLVYGTLGDSDGDDGA